MLRQKVTKLSLVGIIILGFFLFSYSAVRAEENEEGDTYLDINEDTVWHKGDDLNFAKMVYVNPGATLTIEKGAQIKFGKDINSNDTYLSVSGGRVIANGTQEEPIRITADADHEYLLIEFRKDYWEGIPDSLPSFLRYVEIYGGGYQWDTECDDCSAFWHNLISPVYAEIKGSPALSFQGGKAHLENCTFRNNEYADVGVYYDEFDSSVGSDNYLEIVNSNFEKNNDAKAVRSEMYCQESGLSCMKKVFLKNNWYGDANGPSGALTGQITSGKALEGTYYLDSWRKNPLIADPVVIIPGIMGSSKVGSQYKIDPILHTYDNLIASFEENGYEKDKNFFEFPYEWRNSNVMTAEEIEKKITNVKNNTMISKVDLVAHSMGGLVARYYIESPNYQNDVDQLITLGTPHKGSPKSYPRWEAAEGFFSRDEIIAKELFTLEAHSLGYNNLLEYIQSRVISVQELLPDYDYLEKASTSEMKNYPEDYPCNTFLEFLNNQDRINNLDKINFYNIIGNITESPRTIEKFRVVNSTQSGKWEHGMPENLYDVSTDQGMENGEGDETVPLSSADGITADKKIELNSSHSDLPTNAQCYVIKELTGLTECDYVNTVERIADILTFGVFSPIDIQIIAPDGKWIGKNILNLSETNKIEGAYYTGHETENEFVTIPNPLDGEYKIITEGTGEGEYKIEATKISEDENNPIGAIESTGEIIGTAVLGQQEEKMVTVENNEVITENKDTTPPIITGAATTTPNENGWYNNDVTIHFEATDESGIKQITPDAMLTSEGKNQEVIGTATDNFDNTASVTIDNINIDKTKPETAAEIIGTKGNSDWYITDVEIKLIASDNLSGVSKTYYRLDNQEYTEGNNFTISAEGEQTIKYYSEDLAGNKEEEKEIKLKIDQTAPTVAIISPKNKIYRNNKMIEIEYNFSDNFSSADKIQAEKYFDDQMLSADKIDLSLLHLGIHEIKITATDEAGNKSEEEKVNFEITTNINAIQANLDHYYDLKLITKIKTKYKLELELKVIENMQGLLHVFENKLMPKWAKNKVVANLKREINHKIDKLIRDIQSQKNFSETIKSPAKELLLESLKAIKI